MSEAMQDNVAIGKFPQYRKSDGGGPTGGDDVLEPRVARLESDVEYIKRDISEIKPDIKSIDSRLSGIENSLSSAKTTIKVVGGVVTAALAVCTYLFGTYISRMVDALNGIVLK
ncbi:hemolysin XhlA [Cronobacter dublinensis]